MIGHGGPVRAGRGQAGAVRGSGCSARNRRTCRLFRTTGTRATPQSDQIGFVHPIERWAVLVAG
jgi:hypothetical protein